MYNIISLGFGNIISYFTSNGLELYKSKQTFTIGECIMNVDHQNYSLLICILSNEQISKLLSKIETLSYYDFEFESKIYRLDFRLDILSISKNLLKYQINSKKSNKIAL